MAVFKAGAEAAVRRCADVVNAAAQGGSAALHATLEQHGEAVTELTPRDVEELRHAADALRAIAAATSLDDACRRINDLLAGCEPPRLTAHGGTQWHLHIDSDDDARWGEWLIASSAMALAVLVTELQQQPLGICAATDCANVYPAHGPGRPRRYCSSACASRMRVAHHRSGL